MAPGRINHSSCRAYSETVTEKRHGLTICHRLGLGALEPQRGPEAGAVVEAPALLHFGGAALGGDVRAGGPPVAQRGLPALDALAPRARHAHALLEAELLAAGGAQGSVSAFRAVPSTHVGKCSDGTAYDHVLQYTECS